MFPVSALRSRFWPLVALILWLFLSPAHGQDLHQTMPSATSGTFNSTLQHFLKTEPANRTADFTGLTGWTVSDCLPTTSGSKVLAAFACTAYTRNGHYAVQASTAIDLGASPGPACANTDTAWVIITDSLTAPGGNFTQVGTTQYYVDCVTATRPDIPTNALLLFQATISGGAVTAITSEATRRVKTHTVTENMTTSSYAPWIWTEPGPIVTVAATKTLTFGTCPQAGRFQIFAADGVTTGLVRFGVGACDRAYPEWWGESVTMFQYALDALTANGGVVDLGQKFYTQNSITAKSNVIFEGKGIGATTWKLSDLQDNWAYGQSDSSVLVVDDAVVNCGIRDLKMDGNGANNLAAQDGLGVIAPRGFTRCLFENLWIIGAQGDAIGTLIRTRDSTFRNLVIDDPGRSCIASSGGTLANTFEDVICNNPFNSCWDVEPADGAPHLFDAHYSYNTVKNWTCRSPGEHGIAYTFAANVTAGFTGTRSHNVFENISVTDSDQHGVQVTGSHQTRLANISVSGAGAVAADGHAIWIGGYEDINAIGVTLTGCTIRQHKGASSALYIGQSSVTDAVKYIAVTGCTISEKIGTGVDLRIDNVDFVTMGGVIADEVSVAIGAERLNITTTGQGPAIASTSILVPHGLYHSYPITGTTQINQIEKISAWSGRVIALTFDDQVFISHDSETSEYPIYLAHASNATFCAGDTLTLRMVDMTSGETRMQEISRSRALGVVTVTTGTAPSVACATGVVLAHTAATNVTTFDNMEAGVTYTVRCSTANATLVSNATGGNFQLAGNVNFVCSALDMIQLRRPFGLNMIYEVGRSVN